MFKYLWSESAFNLQANFSFVCRESFFTWSSTPALYLSRHACKTSDFVWKTKCLANDISFPAAASVPCFPAFPGIGSAGTLLIWSFHFPLSTLYVFIHAFITWKSWPAASLQDERKWLHFFACSVVMRDCQEEDAHQLNTHKMRDEEWDVMCLSDAVCRDTEKEPFQTWLLCRYGFTSLTCVQLFSSLRPFTIQFPGIEEEEVRKKHKHDGQADCLASPLRW